MPLRTGRVLRELVVLTALWLGPLASSVAAQSEAQDVVAQELKRLTLEELMRVEVSTVLRAPEPTSAVPAAVYVITQDDIRRSGASTLPEVLRLAPGVQVSRIDSVRYAIGMRGFPDRLARAMLVLIDGRAVYSPLFAGTYWEVQDVLLEDVDRIEVIRGPGGTLWGANAVTGIINIITRRAHDTPGFLVTGALGSDRQGPFGLRYGGSVGGTFDYRIYAKGVDRDPQFNPSGNDADTFSMIQGGFRGDWALSRSRRFTLQGDAYSARLGQRFPQPLYSPPFADVIQREAPLSGANVLARWSSPGLAGEYQLQTYYDRTHRDERPVIETRDTFDVDFQHRWRAAERHQLVWGAGYRVSNGRIRAFEPTIFSPPERTDNLYTAFAQDDFALVPGKLRLIFGTKLEHNAYSGLEFQPGARAMWTMNASNSLFVAVTRAVRTPSRVETDYATTSLANPAVPAFVRLQPNPQFQAEKLTAYEAGYRVRPMATLFVSTAAFFNHHDDTLSTELLPAFVETAPGTPRLILPVTFRNGVHGNSHGVEVTADYRPASWWRWTTNYALLRVQFTKDPGSADVSQEGRYERLSPVHQLEIQSSLDLPRGILFDWFLRYASEIRLGPVPAYTTSNIRVSWQPRPDLEVALVGRDLHEPRHKEWGGATEIERSAYVSVTWRR